MKKLLAAVLAIIMVFGAAACDGGKKPAETTVATTEDPNKMEVPDFSELTWEQIEMKYPKLNIKPDYQYSDSVPEGGFIAQEPSAGTKIDKSDKITVTVSSGSKLVEIDDYTGRNIDDARTLLEKQGLKCEVVSVDSEDVTRNCIVKTVPAAREMVEKGTTVTCYVSLGAPEQEIKVPDMVGKSIEQATALAEENGIGLSIGYDNNSDKEPGTVISQSIDPETVVEPNTRVEVVLSGESSADSRKTTISVTPPKSGVSGEYQLKYYIDGTLIEEKTEIKELSLTKKIEWEVTGTDIHTYSVVVTCMATGKSGVLYKMEVDFTKNPPTKDHHDTFNAKIFQELAE